mgnify:CR=1 FL=1
MIAEEYLRIPYVMTLEAIRSPNGDWIRRAEHPELPGCFVDAFSPVEAGAKLEDVRVRYITERLGRGESVPTPRPPLLYAARG